MKTDTLTDLSKEWSHTDGEGYTRVMPTMGFRDGMALLIAIGELAEAEAYFPEVKITREKLTVAIDDSDTPKALRLAMLIDSVIDEADT